MFPHLSRSYTSPVQVAYSQVCSRVVDVHVRHKNIYMSHMHMPNSQSMAEEDLHLHKEKGAPGRGVRMLVNAHF